MNCSLNWLLCIISIYSVYLGLKLNGFCVARFVGYPIWCTCGLFLLLCCFYVICLWLNSAIIYMLGLLSFVSFFREGGGGDHAFTNILIVIIIGCPSRSVCLHDWFIFASVYLFKRIEPIFLMSLRGFFILFFFVCIIDYDIYRLFWSKHKFLFSLINKSAC